MGQGIGKLFGGLQHTGVTGPDGTQYYSNPADAVKAASASLPSANDMIGGDPLNPSVQTPSNLPVVNNPTLSTKGAIFQAIIRGGIGAAAAAGAPTAGQGALQAMHLLNSIDEQRRLNEQQGLITEVQRARLAEQPGRLRLQGAELANVEAQTAYHRRQLELAGKREERAPNAVDLALMAASDDPEKAAFGKKALDELHRGEFKDKVPSSYPALVVASQMEPDPVKRAAYEKAIAHYEQYNARPTKSESESEQDRRQNRDAQVYAVQTLGAFGNDQNKAAAHITALLAKDSVSQGKHLTEHERFVASKAVMLLRKHPGTLEETLANILKNQNPGK